MAVAAAVAMTMMLTTPGSSVSAAAAKAPKRMAFFTDLDAGKVYGVEIKYKKKPKLKLKKTYDAVANPWGVALDPDGKFLLVTDNTLDTVTKLALPSGAVLATIAVGDSPTDVGIVPTGNYAFVVNNGSNNVSVIDTRTDQVVSTIAVKSAPLRLEVNDSGTGVYVANTGADQVSIIDVDKALGFDTGNPVTHLEKEGDCDLSGGIESVRVPGETPFHYIMWSCSSGSSAGARLAAALPRPHGKERSKSSSGDCRHCDDESDEDRRPAPVDRAVKAAFSFSVPGVSDELESVGVARAPAHLDGGFCTTNSLVVSYREAGAAASSLAGTSSYLWRFGENGRELADGYAFGPLFGGSEGSVYANPICGPNCKTAKIVKKTKSLKIAGAMNIMDGTMLPVPFGPEC